MELEQRGKYWFWNPVYGKEYCIGYHHSKGLFNSELVNARYFGTMDGQRVFFREKEDKVLMYHGDAQHHAMWYGEEDGPFFSVVVSEFQDELKGREAEFVKAVLRKQN